MHRSLLTTFILAMVIGLALRFILRHNPDSNGVYIAEQLFVISIENT